MSWSLRKNKEDIFSKYFNFFAQKIIVLRENLSSTDNAIESLVFYLVFDYLSYSKSQILSLLSKALDLNSFNWSNFCSTTKLSAFPLPKLSWFLWFALLSFLGRLFDVFFEISFYVSCIHFVWNEWTL